MRSVHQKESFAHFSPTAQQRCKFGLPLFMATEAVIQAMAAPSLNLVGLHFHLGSQITDSLPYQEALEAVLEFAVTTRENYGLELEELDIGGGFAAHIPDRCTGAEHRQLRRGHNHSVWRQNAAKPSGLAGADHRAGRAIVAQAGIALYQVGSIKDIPASAAMSPWTAVLPIHLAGAYGATQVVLANRMNDKATDTVTIALVPRVR